MKQLLYFLFLFFSSTTFAQLNTNVEWTEQTALPVRETIYYNTGKKLSWNDFQGTATGNPLVAALTFSGFGYSASVRTVNGKGDLNIKVYCYFSKPQSWVREGKANLYVLTHEQHHFDISYIATMLFMDKLQSTKFTLSNYKEQLARIYNECSRIMNKMQDDYDSQTKNGQVKTEQEKWNGIIDNRLQSITK